MAKKTGVKYEWSCESCGARGRGKAFPLETLVSVINKCEQEHKEKSPRCRAKKITLRT